MHKAYEIYPAQVDDFYKAYAAHQAQHAFNVSILNDARRRLEKYSGRTVNNNLLKAFEGADYRTGEIYNRCGWLTMYTSKDGMEHYINLARMEKGEAQRPKLTLDFINRQIEEEKAKAKQAANCDIAAAVHKYNIIAAEYNKAVGDLTDIPGFYDAIRC